MADLDLARELFREYAAQLGIDLCFQSFDQELATLPGDYAPPRGRLHIEYQDGQPAACVALRPLSQSICELKRLYVRPAFRGRGLGRRLAELMIAEARAIGYDAMRLDTLPSMREGIALYRSLGFREVPPYRTYTSQELLFFELDLTAPELRAPARQADGKYMASE
jgi:putative acetyltransferase